MATKDVSLPADVVGLVENEVSKDAFASSSEGVCGALCLLQHDRALEHEKLAILHREINIGLEAAATGRFSIKTVNDIAEEVCREHLDVR